MPAIRLCARRNSQEILCLWLISHLWQCLLTKEGMHSSGSTRRTLNMKLWRQIKQK